MADTQVEASVDSRTDKRGLWGPYWLDVNTGVIVFAGGVQDISFARTTDGGVNWATTEMKSGAMTHLACWYDKETPGDTGTLVHVAWLDDALNQVLYRTIDVSDGSLGTERVVDSTVTVPVDSQSTRVAMTKTANGNLLIAISTQTEIECYRSTDSGANWTDRADVFELATAEDWLLLFPAATADGADACALFWDRSANAISLKMYDDSANSWTEKDISAAVDVIQHINMDGAIRHSDSHLLLAFHSEQVTATDDILTFDLTVDSIASPTVTAKANVMTDEAESTQCAVFINQQNDDVYVAWLSGGTWQLETDAVYKKSTDGMGSWGAEQAYSETTDDNRILHAGRTVGDGGGRYQPVFYNDDTTDIWVNLVNDIEIAAVTGVTRALAGDQPAATGTLTRIKQALRALAGDQPAATGTLTRIEQAVRALSGSQPAATGTLTRIEKALRALAGTQPAGTGVLTRIEKAIRALAGSQPAATGTLTYPLAVPRQIFIRGEVATISVRGEVQTIAIRGEQKDIRVIRGDSDGS